MSDLTEKYPYVHPFEFPIVERYGEFLANTGGNDPLDLLNDLGDPKKKNLMWTNVVRFVLAVAVSSQVALLRTLEAQGLLGLHEAPSDG